MSWALVSIVMGRGFKAQNGRCAKAWAVGGGTSSSTAHKEHPCLLNFWKVHSYIYSTALHGSTNWPWSGAMLNKVRAWEARISRLTFRPRESWIIYRIRTAWKKMGLPLLAAKCRQIWVNHEMGYLRY